MKDIRQALEIGARTVIAMTCWRCGVLLGANHFERYSRKRGQRSYIDRRCGVCRWAHIERTGRPLAVRMLERA